ncbi:Protein canopy 2 [Mactra antiquata]
MDLSPWLCILNLFMILKVSQGLDRELSCAVCRAVVDEVNYSISKVDPKKTIQVGSFRVDSRGNQGTYEKPYARSEVHLIEVFESVCDNFKDYAETSNDAGGRSVCRTKARDGKTLALKDIKINSEIQKTLKHSCESLIEDYEEDMIAIFRRDEQPNIDTVICAEITARCTASDMNVPMPVTEFTTEEFAKELQDDDNDDNNDDDGGDDKEEVKSKDSVDMEEELLKLYEKDNEDSIVADTVTDLNMEEVSDGEHTSKEEL